MDDTGSGTWGEKLIEASQTTGQVDFTAARQAFKEDHGEEPILSVDLFRELYAGDRATAKSRKCGRWRVKGARFSGHLNLSDCACSGGALPPLEFEDCLFPEGFSADHSVIRRLSFFGCSFGVFPGHWGHKISISLHNTRVEGDLKLEGLKSLDENHLLSLFAFGIHVAGSVRLSETELKAPRDNRSCSYEPAHYALDLYGAEIRNDVKLFPHVTLSGGLRVRTARIGGDLVFADLNVSDDVDPKHREQGGLWSRSAIEATSADIGGHIFFQSYRGLNGFTASGEVTFFGFESKGSVVLSGARFSCPDSSGSALNLSTGKMKGGLISDTVEWTDRPSTLTCDGTITLTGLSVEGSVYLAGSSTNILANLIKVSGDTTLAIQVSSSLNLGGADLKGSLDLSGFRFFTPNPGQRRDFQLNLRDAQIGHSLLLAAEPSPLLQLESCHRRKLHCLPDYFLYELYLRGRGSASILFKPGDKPLLLDGVSAPIHRLARSGALRLDTPESVKDYIRFFGAYVWGEEGPFVIVENASQIPHSNLPTEIQEQLQALQEIEVNTDFSEKDWIELRKLISPQPSDAEWTKYKEDFERHAVRALTHVRYGANLFRVTFVVLQESLSTRPEPFGTGWIAMVQDHPVTKLDPRELPIYERPFTRPKLRGQTHSTNNFSSDYRSDLQSETIPRLELTLRIPEWLELLERRIVGFQEARIDLTNATCGSLDDADGRAWGRELSALSLENFTYTRINAPKSKAIKLNGTAKLLLFFFQKSARIPKPFISGKRPFQEQFWYSEKRRAAISDRQDWLGHMQSDPFLPQPYAHLASVLNEAGDNDGAKEIERRKFDLEIQEKWQTLREKGALHFPILLGSWVFWTFIKLGFNYGLSWARATLTFILCLLLGWVGVTELNQRGYLVQNTSAAATLLAKGTNGELTAVFPRATRGADSEELKCGAAINGLLYAADVFIPLLDLRQEERCDIRSSQAREIDPFREWAAQRSLWHKLTHSLWAIFHAPVLWAQFAKSAYAVLGWVVVSLTILTYSGMLRRWGEK
jgi:hypothetical protein